MNIKSFALFGRVSIEIITEGFSLLSVAAGAIGHWGKCPTREALKISTIENGNEKQKP